jgi:hypothetical protein
MGWRERYRRWVERQALAHPVPTSVVIGVLWGVLTYSLVAALTDEPLRGWGVAYWAVAGLVAFGPWTVWSIRRRSRRSAGQQ